MARKQVDQLKNDLDTIIQDIKPDRMEEIYFRKSYDTLKLLWLDTDQDAFEKAEKDLLDFIRKMTPEQYQAALYGEIRAYLNLLYDLRCLLRSEGFGYLSIVISHNHILRMILDSLETYEGTGDQYWYNEAKDIILQVTDDFHKKFGTNETLEDMRRFIEKHRPLEDLTSEDREHLDFLAEFVKRQEFLNRS